MDPIGSTSSVLANSRRLGPRALEAPSAKPASFEQIMAQHASAPTRAEQARRTSEQLVATTFVKPILAQAREMNNAPPPFAPTQAEKQFGALLDNRIADDLVSAMRLPIVERLTGNIVDRIPESQRGERADATRGGLIG